MVVGWMFGGVGFHTTFKYSKLSYKIGYFITAELFCPIHPNCPDIYAFVDVHVMNFVDVSILRGYYLHIMDIYVFYGYYLY